MNAKVLIAVSLVLLPLAVMLRFDNGADDADRARAAIEQLRSGPQETLVRNDIDQNWRYLRPFACAAVAGLVAAICLRESRRAPVQGE